MTSEIETNMVSVERISEYQNTPQEAPFSLPENDPPKEWPQYGVVKFENYQTRYREGKKYYFSLFVQSDCSYLTEFYGKMHKPEIDWRAESVITNIFSSENTRELHPPRLLA